MHDAGLSTRPAGRNANRPTLTLTNHGLVLGGGTRLVRMRGGRLDLEGYRERVLALLAVAYRHPVSTDVLLHVRDASAHWQRGDKALANLRLAFAEIPRLEDRRQIVSLSVAEQLLDKGVSPHTLLSKLGFDSADLQKFNPSQPRLPAGSGRSSGQWARAAGAVAGAAGSFLAGASPRIVSALAAFGSRLSVATAVFGALFIPTPNSGGITEGDLPGAPGHPLPKGWCCWIAAANDDGAGRHRDHRLRWESRRFDYQPSDRHGDRPRLRRSALFRSRCRS